jgi:hypothetical protein
MAQSLFNLSKENFGSTEHPYVKALPLGGSSSLRAQTLSNGNIVAARPLSRNSGASNYINICDDFDWTTTPVAYAGFNKKLVPRGDISEYRVEDTSVIAALLYASEATLAAGASSANLLSNIAKKAGLDTLSSGIAGANQLAASTQNSINSAVRNRASINAKYDFPDAQSSPWMQPYKDLYSLAPTNFKYLLPYLDDQAFCSIKNSWPDISYPLSNSINEMQNIVTGIAKISAPGQYIEKPKMFDPAASNNPSVTFNFPLFNTQSFEQACANYQFLWLLIFQNTPQRVTKSLLEMPKMYTVNVPGVCYIQYGYLESLNIRFIGNRRHVNINMPQTSIAGLNSSIPAIMPDAYDVSITFGSLNVNNSNMLLEMWKKSTSSGISF